jgi:hypothetical protein
VDTAQRLPLALPAITAQTDAAVADQIGGPAAVAKGLVQAADVFASTYWLAACLVLLTFVPVFFLPRKREATPPARGRRRAPVVSH